MAVNATGVVLGIKHAISAMIANGGGSIVNLSSIAGIIGSEHVHIAYNASKAAVRLMTKWVAVQHGKDNIRANSVHPGIMPPMRTSGRTADPTVRAERMRFIPMRRPGEVDEVAYTILFLASDESSLHHRLRDPRRRRYSRHISLPPNGVVARDVTRGPRRPSSTAQGFPRTPSAKSCWEGRYQQAGAVRPHESLRQASHLRKFGRSRC